MDWLLARRSTDGARLGRAAVWQRLIGLAAVLAMLFTSVAPVQTAAAQSPSAADLRTSLNLLGVEQL